VTLENLASQIETTLPQLQRAYYRLALLVGGPSAGKTRLLRLMQGRTHYPFVNVNLELSEKLLDYTKAERPRLVPRLMGETIKSHNSSVVLLDNLEMLFDAQLSLNPLQMLQSMSRNVTLIAAWRGTYASNNLIYAEPWHAEYRHYPLAPQDAAIFQLD